MWRERTWLSLALSRVVGAAFVVWIAVTVSFVAAKLIPGDPVDVMLGPLAQVSEQTREQIRADLGLDQPVFAQYVQYLSDLATGNFGQSYQLDQPVLEVLGAALIPTAQLAFASLGVAAFFVMFGVIVGRQKMLGRLVSGTQVLAVTVPVFWIGYLLLIVFSFTLGWFPATTSGTLSSLVLPAVTLAIPIAGILGHLIGSGMSDTHTRRWALSVKARGLSNREFDSRHAARHGLSAAVPLTAQIFGGLLGGTILVEQVFSRPGLGTVALTAITSRDMTVILGFVALSAVFFAVLSIFADVVMWIIDPRTRDRTSEHA